MNNKFTTDISNETDSEKSIYIMISQTNTKFGNLVRKFGKIKYNHAAISLDAGLDNLFAFARPQHNAVLLAHLVPETVSRYTLGKTGNVPVVIFKINISENQYEWVKSTILSIQSDEDYIYNLFSVLTYPLLKGIHTYKAFSCIEFVVFLLQGVGYNFSRPLCSYKPDELLDILTDNIIFNGNLLDYKKEDTADIDYFAPFSREIFRKSIRVLKKLVVRAI